MLQRFVLAAIALTVSACGTSKSDAKLLDETLNQYASTLRWGEPDQLLGFIDPDTLKDTPVRPIDLERLRQVRVAGWRAQPPAMISDKRARQIAQVDLVNINTQKVRSAVEVSDWRWDATAKRWWLVSGLPRFEAPR